MTGQIEPPSGSTPPMSAQCSVSIESEGGFSVAQALIFIPSSPGFVELWQPYETLWQPGSPPPTLSPPYEAIAWEFVVTQDGATPVAASTMDATYPSDQGASTCRIGQAMAGVLRKEQAPCVAVHTSSLAGGRGPGGQPSSSSRPVPLLARRSSDTKRADKPRRGSLAWASVPE